MVIAQACYVVQVVADFFEIPLVSRMYTDLIWDKWLGDSKSAKFLPRTSM